MSPRSNAPLRVITDPRPPPAVPSAVLGMSAFILTEIMMFAGMISAFTITKSQAVLGWPPPGQPRLPVEETALNTVALLLSGMVLFFAGRAFSQERKSARTPLIGAIALGAFFVIFQGFEWAGLIREGLTFTGGPHGAFFYFIVGMHALHAIAALVVLGVMWNRLNLGVLQAASFQSARVFWYFVVGVWPVLYWLVYL